jgi:malonyl CoA-acyl carrier protein transacylase/phosphopantetheinyl transferase (holo-ACP synthase)
MKPAAATCPAAHSLRSPWDTELFVVHAADRSLLGKRLEALAREAEAGGGESHLERAARLAVELRPGGLRMAIVAADSTDLAGKARRAADRLADANCRAIRDASGIYFSHDPLGLRGKTAFLYPGEGAQYLGMLADLQADFPEVKRCIEWCDEQARLHALKPVSRFVNLPPPSDTAARTVAETELRQLGNAMFSVLMADWALHELIMGLGIQPDAVAGHSAGELSALWASGGIAASDVMFPGVATTMDELDSQADAGASPRSLLLAVGASRERVAAVLEEVARESDDPEFAGKLFLAMDNCPHQTVLVGTVEAAERMEQALTARRMVVEHLTLKRPYHTPLFEPFMGPLRGMFDDIEFHTPRVTTYSCTTGQPFPSDPDAVRELAIAHWASPVQFSRLIRRMYDDGFRVFVEVGPRGNLSAFVEDILRGREFLAVPSNQPRRSGPTQLNHLVGQCAVHHVPVRIERLFGSAPDLEHEAPGGRGVHRTPLRPVGGRSAHRAAVMLSYLAVMEQFLDVNRALMPGSLRRSTRRRSAPPGRGSTPIVRRPAPPPAAVRRPSAALPEKAPMAGTVVRHEPGVLRVVRRPLDLAEDRYAADHTVGGRSVSHLDPDRHGLPVMPMTFILEMMAEVAADLFPNSVVLGLKDVRLLKWLAFQEGRPGLVEVRARLASDTNGTREVKVDVRELEDPAADAANASLASIGTVMLGTRHANPPLPDTSPLAGARPCRISLHKLYTNLFHGPQFEGVEALTSVGDDAIEARVRVLPRSGLFQSTASPALHFDPVLIDVSMHPLAAWHLEQPDQSGRILLPYELEKIELFGPPPEVGEQCRSRCRIENQSSRRFTHAVDCYRQDGKLWCRLAGARYWRFYLPFGEINFHGPKDEYFLSTSWPAALPCPANSADDQGRPRAVCARLAPPKDLLQSAMQLAAAQVALCDRERAEFQSLAGRADVRPDQRIDWLFGRLAGKDAVRMLWHTAKGKRLFPIDMDVVHDSRGRPSAEYLDRQAAYALPSLSISHSGGLMAAMAAWTDRLGIDLEKIEPRSPGFEEIAFDESERILLGSAPDRDEWIARFWSAKEAVGKALGCGLAGGPRAFNIRAFVPGTGAVQVALGADRAAEFADLAGRRILVHTLRDGEFVVATTLCEPAP